MTPALAHEKFYTIDDIYNLKDGERAELVDGHIYYMSPPDTKHQRILNFINTDIIKYTPPPLPSFYLQMIPNIWSRTYL